MPRVFVETHGCSLSQSDSEAMSGILASAGYEIVKAPPDADLNVLVTCVVKGPTESRMLHRIREYTAVGKPLIVAGCMPQVERKAIEEVNRRASLIGPYAVGRVAEAAEAALAGGRFVELGEKPEAKLCLPRIRQNPVVGIVPIASGCLGECSFCQVRFARGSLCSYPLEAVLLEAERALEEGCKELWLTSQDNGCYGLDIGSSLPELIRAVCGLEGDFRVRVGMMNPTYVKRFLGELLDAYQGEKVFKFLHLPVQSMSPRILRLMRRGYEPEEAMEIIEAFRGAFPDSTVATDLIVGFPTETGEDFQATLGFIRDVKPEVVNISKFSPRPGTEAAGLLRCPVETVAARSRLLTEACRKEALERNRRWIGWEGSCLIDERGLKPGSWVGRNAAYRPIILSGLPEDLLGKFIAVKVIGVTSRCLVGEWV